MNDEKIIQCDDCGAEWPYNETQPKVTTWITGETNWADNNDEIFIVLAFHCPKCNKEYVITVDNDVTASEREEYAKVDDAVRRAMRRCKGAMASKDVIIYRNLVEKRKRIQARLNKHQDILLEAYHNAKAAGTLKEVNVS